MLDEQIINILLKYKNENSQEIANINNAINSIKGELESVHNHLTTEFSKEIASIEEDGDMNMFQDIQSLKKYIRNFNSYLLPVNNMVNLKSGEGNNNISNATSSQPPKVSEKPLELYLTPDSVCPLCEAPMWEIDEYYYDYHENKPKKISILKCDVCGRKYVTFDEIEYLKKDNKYTSLTLYNDYFHILNIYDTITVQVKKTLGHCINKGHKFSDITIQVPVVYESGEVDFEVLPATYCEQCQKYMVLKSDFDNVIGIILCKVIDETYESKNSSDGFSFEDRQSKLYQHGYHAQSKNALTEEQRHIILSSLLNARIMKKGEISSYLKDLTVRYKNNHNFSEAIKRWNDDYKFMRSLSCENLPSHVADKIVLKFSCEKSLAPY